MEEEDEQESTDGEMTKKKTPCLEDAMTDEEEEGTKLATPRTITCSNNASNTPRKNEFYLVCLK